MQRNRRSFRILRILCYPLPFLLFALLPYGAVAEGTFRCPATCFGLHCPGCGVTRAMSLLMHGRFGEALEMNSVFCLVILPLLLAVILQDGWTVLSGRKKSFLEYLLGC